ncbi:hypothetical protein Hanom_Chr16g01424031 [Helianthus anomalus]
MLRCSATRQKYSVNSTGQRTLLIWKRVCKLHGNGRNHIATDTGPQKLCFNFLYGI